MPGSLNVRFEAGGLRFTGYPFSSASIYPNGSLHREAIREALPDMAPPEIRTTSGEVLFVTAVQKVELVDYALDGGIPLVRRTDVWDLILEPFLDTEFSLEDQEKTLVRLERNGVSRELCEELRTLLGRPMMKWNFGIPRWDWVHLGLCDALEAVMEFGHWSAEEYDTFYWRAMEIAERGSLDGPARCLKPDR